MRDPQRQGTGAPKRHVPTSYTMPVDLLDRLDAYRASLEELSGCRISASAVVRKLIERGLEAEGAER